MLVLSRKLNEKILLPGTHTAIQVVSIKPGVVRLGIEAPADVLVLREEIPDRHTEWTKQPTLRLATEEKKLKAVGDLTAQRLKLARADLATLRGQLHAGLLDEAETTLDKLDEEIHALRQRVEKETEENMPRKAR